MNALKGCRGVFVKKAFQLFLRDASQIGIEHSMEAHGNSWGKMSQ